MASIASTMGYSGGKLQAFPAPHPALRRGGEDIHEFTSWMPPCRGDARHRLVSLRGTPDKE